MCKSTELTDSCLRVNDLGISTLFTMFTFHFSYLSLLFGALIKNSTEFLTHISPYAIFYRLNAQVILVLWSHTLNFSFS